MISDRSAEFARFGWMNMMIIHAFERFAAQTRRVEILNITHFRVEEVEYIQVDFPILVAITDTRIEQQRIAAAHYYLR